MVKQLSGQMWLAIYCLHKAHRLEDHQLGSMPMSPSSAPMIYRRIVGSQVASASPVGDGNFAAFGQGPKDQGSCSPPSAEHYHMLAMQGRGLAVLPRCGGHVHIT